MKVSLIVLLASLLSFVTVWLFFRGSWIVLEISRLFPRAFSVKRKAKALKKLISRQTKNRLFGVDVDYMVAVSLHETGGLTSHLFRHCRNLFGMRPAQKRKDYGKSVENNYNCYQGFGSSIQDYIDLVKSYPETRAGYITGLSGLVSAMNRHGYFTDTFKRYFFSVSQWYRRLK